MARKDSKTRRYFLVQGSGAFFFDMLRYDACWPAEESESSKLYGDHLAPFRQIIMATDNHHLTPLRWASRGWSMSHTAYSDIGTLKAALAGGALPRINLGDA